MLSYQARIWTQLLFYKVYILKPTVNIKSLTYRNIKQANLQEIYCKYNCKILHSFLLGSHNQQRTWIHQQYPPYLQISFCQLMVLSHKEKHHHVTKPKFVSLHSRQQQNKKTLYHQQLVFIKLCNGFKSTRSLSVPTMVFIIRSYL